MANKSELNKFESKLVKIIARVVAQFVGDPSHLFQNIMKPTGVVPEH